MTRADLGAARAHMGGRARGGGGVAGLSAHAGQAMEAPLCVGHDNGRGDALPPVGLVLCRRPVLSWDKSVTNRSLPACKRLEARAELEPLGAKTPYQIPAQGMVCPVPLFDMATWVQRHRARGVHPSCYTERAPAAVHHKTLPRPDTEELSGPVGPLSVTRTGRCPVLDPYSR